MSRTTTPYCRICGVKESLHEHHVVPRAYGGERGKTVTLCANCHNWVHRNAGDGGSNDGYELPKDCPPENVDYARRLINVIKCARMAVSSSVNKRATIQSVLTAEQARQLDLLKDHFGLTSRDETLKRIIAILYKSLIGSDRR